MFDPMPYLPIAGLLTLFVLIERFAKAPRTDWVINLSGWLLQIVGGLTIYGLFRVWQGPSLIDAAALPLWAGVVLSIAAADLAEYGFHRLQHGVPLLWAMHSFHHSDPEMSALTTMRHYWAEPILKTLTVWTLSAMLINPAPEAIAIYTALSFWNVFVHARLPVNFGWFSWIINSPAYHRRHHSSLPEHFNSNFAALFPIWDVLTGSYHRPDGFPPTGLDRRPTNLTEVIIWPLIVARTNRQTST